MAKWNGGRQSDRGPAGLAAAIFIIICIFLLRFSQVIKIYKTDMRLKYFKPILSTLNR